MSNNIIIDHQNINVINNVDEHRDDDNIEPMITDDYTFGSSPAATTPRDAAWERRRRMNLRQAAAAAAELTDEDLSELKGCIELGFGFNEEDGQGLCETLPALDLYFAVNRQVSLSPVSTPTSRVLMSSSSSLSSSSSSLSTSSSIGRSNSPMGSPRVDSDAWKICSPGDDPEQVKTKLRHWAQAVACSVMQSF